MPDPVSGGPLAGATDQLLESSPDGVVIVGRDGLIQLVNGQTERLFGYGREELTDRPIELLIARLRREWCSCRSPSLPRRCFPKSARF